MFKLNCPNCDARLKLVAVLSEKNPACPDCCQRLKIEGVYISILAASVLIMIFTAIISFSENNKFLYFTLNFFGFVLSVYTSYKLFIRVKKENGAEPN